MTVPDLRSVLRRADERWCKTSLDDPLDDQRLDHLVQAAATVPIDQPGVGELFHHLGQLIDAITTTWNPAGDLTAQVAHALELVHAASAQLNELDATHVHRYPRATPTSRPRACACGQPFPKTAKAGLTGATPNRRNTA